MRLDSTTNVNGNRLPLRRTTVQRINYFIPIDTDGQNVPPACETIQANFKTFRPLRSVEHEQ